METVGGIAKLELLWRTNIFSVVAGGSQPKYAENTGTVCKPWEFLFYNFLCIYVSLFNATSNIVIIYVMCLSSLINMYIT